MIIIKCLHALYIMRKLFNSVIILFITCSLLSPIFQVKADWDFKWDNPVAIVDEIKTEANKKDAVQDTDLDVVTSKISKCDWISPDARFTITRTLCSIKAKITCSMWCIYDLQRRQSYWYEMDSK